MIVTLVLGLWAIQARLDVEEKRPWLDADDPFTTQFQVRNTGSLDAEINHFFCEIESIKYQGGLEVGGGLSSLRHSNWERPFTLGAGKVHTIDCPWSEATEIMQQGEVTDAKIFLRLSWKAWPWSDDEPEKFPFEFELGDDGGVWRSMAE